MLKIFVVEDEIIIREGIKNNVNWNEEGFIFSGEASDGELALPMIRQEKPDILITDIKMPFMDGLELSRLVKSEMPWIKIIILSGYDDFKYAKDAIGIGVTQYVLKPVSGAKLLETVKEVAAVIEKEQEQDNFSAKYHKEMQEYEMLQKKQLFLDLIYQKMSLSEILMRSQKLGIELTAKDYNIILFSFYQYEGRQTEYSKQVAELEERLTDVFSNRHHMLLFQHEMFGWAFLVKGSDHEPAETVTMRVTDELVSIIKLWPEVSYFVATGKPVQRLSDVPVCFEKASHAFSYQFIMKRDQVISYEDVLHYSDEGRGLSVKALNPDEINKTSLERFIKSGLIENVTEFVESYLNAFGTNTTSKTFRQYIAMDVRIVSAAVLDEIGIEKGMMIETVGDLDIAGKSAECLDDTRKYIEKVLTAALKLRDKISTQKYSKLIHSAVDYIDQNYSNEDFSLNEVAKKVNVSPTYFSVIFSQETGMTFSEYLSKVRMEKAKELLRCTSMKSSEIGYAIGYKNNHYFSYIFKKIVGITPKEYRTTEKSENDQ